MSLSYDIGFVVKPDLNSLDDFMQERGFTAEGPEADFARVYTHNAQPAMKFFYAENPADYRDFFGKQSIQAYGELVTYALGAVPDAQERARIIKEKNVRTQHDWFRHLSPERLRFYEIALAFRDTYKAIALSVQTGEEINPEKPFPDV
ncbi:hypothetical protein C4573_03090 [Candidatus Woesearchaeota archaeon]|nr:MAG: hypothetical protein C4573_03090 [Candidatus Woesearchaeota archaeon]